MSRPYDCDSYLDLRAAPAVAQVQVLVNYGGTDWRVIFHADGGTQVSVSMRVNDRSGWYVPNDEQESDAALVATVARKLIGGHPFKAKEESK